MKININVFAYIFFMLFSCFAFGQTDDLQYFRGDEFQYFDGFKDLNLSPPRNGELEDFSFSWSNYSFTTALHNRAILHEAQINAQRDRWYRRQLDLIKEYLENKYNRTYASYDEAKNDVFLRTERDHIYPSSRPPRNKYYRLINDGKKKVTYNIGNLKALEIRKTEIQSGNIDNSGIPFMYINGTSLADITSVNILNNYIGRHTDYLKFDISEKYINTNIFRKIETLPGDVNFESHLLNLKNNYYNGFNDWDRLNLMHFFLNYEHIKKYLSSPYILPTEFSNFYAIDKATPTNIEDYARRNRGGGKHLLANECRIRIPGPRPIYKDIPKCLAAQRNYIDNLLSSSNSLDALAEMAIQGLGTRNVNFLKARPDLKQKVINYFKANDFSRPSHNAINYLLNQYQDENPFIVDTSLYFSPVDLLIGDIEDLNRAVEFCSHGEGNVQGVPHFGNVLAALFETETDNDFKGFIIREMFKGKGINVPEQNVVPNSWYGENFKFVNRDNGCIRIEFINEQTNNTPPDCQTDDYEAAIRRGDLVFTKKYGWVDMRHAFANTNRPNPYIGAENLWRQLKNPPTSSQIYQGYYSVNYKQDVVRAGISIGIERQYLVRPGLTLEQRKSVALAIFQDVSIAFESLQSLHPTSTSSFSPEDLPSNMLSFYRHVEELTDQQILNVIETVGIEESLRVIRLYPCTFADKRFKNKTFEPVRFESPYTSGDVGIPTIFNSIQPFEIKPASSFGNADLILWEQDIISN
ncbi:exported hypothetical protein [Tenacibaculum maritimum]|uniref:hypothetical protein n=1 Tax=Tenacibaculum maritimum TaxID=107401 RepID=UPI0012E62078|nr:hypothetical protein [Tenacibaculum maritimum]CAA0183155.1 exported hypothetical protein [Tenacibaculum maritimum]